MKYYYLFFDLLISIKVPFLNELLYIVLFAVLKCSIYFLTILLVLLLLLLLYYY